MIFLPGILYKSSEQVERRAAGNFARQTNSFGSAAGSSSRPILGGRLSAGAGGALLNSWLELKQVTKEGSDWQLQAKLDTKKKEFALKM